MFGTFQQGRAHVSKHRQFDDDGKHIPGRLRIGEHSGLRKLMRAARRGKVPAERIGVITRAMESAVSREAAYLNSSPMKRAHVANLLAEKARRRAVTGASA